MRGENEAERQGKLDEDQKMKLIRLIVPCCLIYCRLFIIIKTKNLEFAVL